MPARILSLDLDWFNYLSKKKDYFPFISDFFSQLKESCVLPNNVDLVPEHHYLYPWATKILNGLTCRVAHVVNIDQHHDFYELHKINHDSPDAEVGCWNFFAYMAHQRMMTKYIWVTNAANERGTNLRRRELKECLQDSASLRIKKFWKDVSVAPRDLVFDVVYGRKFDGFMIIRSPEYTKRNRSVYHAVDRALLSVFPKMNVRRYKCRTNFKNHRVHHRAEALFLGV